MRIYVGYKLHIQLSGNNFSVLEVIGYNKIRKTHWYIVQNAFGDKFSMRRESLLADIQSGNIRVSA